MAEVGEYPQALGGVLGLIHLQEQGRRVADYVGRWLRREEELAGVAEAHRVAVLAGGQGVQAGLEDPTPQPGQADAGLRMEGGGALDAVQGPAGVPRQQEQLYLGGQHYRHGLGRMARLGISGTLNLREKADDRRRGVALERHLWLPTVDDSAPHTRDLRQASVFISEALADGRGVYVHCLSGVGRAATTVAAYLVTTGLAPDQAWATIRRVRPFIRPSVVQMAAVEGFHAQSPA